MANSKLTRCGALADHKAVHTLTISSLKDQDGAPALRYRAGKGSGEALVGHWGCSYPGFRVASRPPFQLMSQRGHSAPRSPALSWQTLPNARSQMENVLTALGPVAAENSLRPPKGHPLVYHMGAVVNSDLERLEAHRLAVQCRKA